MDLIAYFAQIEIVSGAIGALTLIGLFLVAIYILSGFRIVKEWERAPVLRLGRYIGLKGPGWFWILPGIDKIPQIVTTRIQTYSF
ncbi:MAG: SPFH domain-containing protein, partial [Candidatus Hodarchaeales archaeon]